MDLPVEMMAEIISRTPVRTIVNSKSVCKRWRSIIAEPNFVDLHLSRSSEMLIFHQGDDDYEHEHFALVDLDDEHDQHDINHVPLMRFSLGPDFRDNVVLSGSINGLICFEDIYNDSAYVCNPVTQEYILLPDSEYTRKSDLKGYYEFGFFESNKLYKIVHFYEGSFPSTEYNLGSEVYTLGTGMWRDLGHVPFHLNGDERGLYVSGNIHWLADDDEVICTFDLDKESFHPIKAPPRASGNTELFRNLGVHKGYLCICEITMFSELSIWMMRDGVEHSWTKELIITPTFPVHDGINTDRVRVLKVLKDGHILMYCDDLQLFTYHPRHKTLQHHIFPEGEWLTFDAVTYVPSFISLKCFSLERVERWKSSSSLLSPQNI